MSAKRARSPGGADAGPTDTILLVDAGLAAGWRRAVPDLDQLDEVTEAARRIVPDTVVLADASLKWSLPEDQQERFERYRASAAVLCAPGGTRGGHHEFLAAAARAAVDAGREVWVLSGLALGDGGWRLARLRRPAGTWTIELVE